MNSTPTNWETGQAVPVALNVGNLEQLQSQLRAALGDRILALKLELGELTLEVAPQDWLATATFLRDNPSLGFEQLIDLCGVDYLHYGDGAWQGQRFAVVAHLLSVSHNWRLRVRTFCADPSLPVVASLLPVWSSCGWYEREAFDLFGILFEGHPDLRRILTDYGFIGHPFRRDFPISGTVEMHYDETLGRVVYRPVTVEPRENTPRVIREDNYAKGSR